MRRAGTVLTVEQVEQARAPVPSSSSPRVQRGRREALHRHRLARPSRTVTPSEVTAAENLGLKVTKFFPAAQYGGLNTIKALAAPFVGHRFMPTGGVNEGNVQEYLAEPKIMRQAEAGWSRAIW